MNDATDRTQRRTYLALRAAMVILPVWLLIACTIAHLHRAYPSRWPLKSVSAYYYTSAQPVFIGVLIGIGVLLIVIQGSTPWEDAALNLAGFLAPFVALIPPLPDTRCAPKENSCVRLPAGVTYDTVQESIHANFLAVVPIWVALVACFGWQAWRYRSAGDRVSFRANAGVCLGMTVLGVIAVWLRRSDDLPRAHFWAAFLMFVFLIASVGLFAREVDRPRQRAYRRLFWLMAGTAVVIIAVGLLWPRLFGQPWSHWALVLEVVPLTEFVLYWLYQGKEVLTAGPDATGFRSATRPALPVSPP